ncbi:MDR family MFS transporter [Pseudomonas aeruginosa]|uniref:MDR family MFS transporter n=1 Tax=Pseudomonas aeruginosa TaxID=287 RepID=UPI0038BE5B4B|nr:MFS transporter [Pseudomonas aeruginosa]HCL3149218.1 MFS transporter [Pseudomonas aeruginosa]
MSDNTFSVQRFRALPTEIHVMLVGTLLTRGAYFMVWPFLALLLWREFRLSASAIGLLLALATVCGALSGIYTGWLSDRFGRKRLIFFGTSLSGLSFVLLGFSGQPLSYGLAISGVSIGCALLESSCKALIGDRVEDRRSRELALYCRYFLINLGAALGPLIGLTLGVAAQAGTFLVTALVYFCYGLLLWRLLHHLELKRRSLAPRSSTGFLEACLSMARHRAFTLLLLCNMLAALIYATFDSTLVQYLTRSGLPDVVNSIALLVTINALTIVVAQFPLLRLLENTGTGGRLMLGMLLMLLAQLGFAWTPVTLFAGLALATVVLSLGELIVFPTFSVEVDQLTPDDLRGSYFGAANLYSLGTALAPLYGGIMLDHAGSQALYLGLAALCGVIMLLQVGAAGLRQAERAGG